MGVVIVAIAAIGVIAYFLIEASNVAGETNSGAHPISLAIGVAEGGYDASGNNLSNGSLPSKNHNPGDLTVDVNSTGQGLDSNGFVIYADDTTGYAALDYQVSEWLNGTSSNAGPDSTIDQISQFYTTDTPPGAQANWASNVASVLGVPSSTPISQIANPPAASAPTVAADNSGAAPDTSTGGDDDTTAGNMSDPPTSDDSEGDE